MDRNVIILVVLVFLFAIFQYVADKIQTGDCQKELMTIRGKGNLEVNQCCECAIDIVKESKFKILAEQVKMNGISALINVDDPLLDVFDKSWTTCYKSKTQNSSTLSFSTFQIDSLTTSCKKEYDVTELQKEMDVEKFCRCSVEMMQKEISVRELLNNKFSFSNDEISIPCMAQSKIAIDTIQ